MSARVSRILWGVNNENVLELGYPLSEVVTDREPREGSDFVQGSSGVEDSWITGWDYTLECTAKFLPANPQTSPAQSALTGAAGLQGFLDWARAKNPFSFVPDLAAPLFALDGCYLADPLRGGRGLTPRLDWSQRVKIRNPTLDLGLAVTRGLMFEYVAGADISPLGLNGSFAAAGARTFIDNRGVIVSAATNALRDRHYPNGFSAGLPIAPRTTLLELGRTNTCLQSESFDTATWVKAGGPPTVVANATAAPDLVVTGDRIVPAASSQNPNVSQAMTITADENVAVSMFVKASGYTSVLLRFSNAGSTQGFQADFDTSTGLFGSIATGFGGGTLTGNKAIPLANGWYRVLLWGKIAGGITAATLFAFVYDTITRANAQQAYTGDGTQGVYLWGAQVERLGTTDSSAPSAYVATTTATVARPADTALGFSPWPFSPQPQFTLVELIEVGNQYPNGLLRMGDGPNASTAAFAFLGASGGGYRCDFGNGSANDTRTLTPSAAMGADVALMQILFADAHQQLRKSVNGGADTSDTGAVLTGGFPTAWAGPLWLGALGTPNVGENAIVRVKIGPLTFAGQTIDTTAKALAA